MKTKNLFACAMVSILAGTLLTGLVLPAQAQSTLTNTIRDTIASPGETDPYTFTLQQEGYFYFDSLTNLSSASWSLSGPPGMLVTNRAFSTSDADQVVWPILRLPAGTYGLTVSANAAATPAYAFRFVNLAEAPLLTVGSSVTNLQLHGGETAYYQFTASRGDRMTFTNLSFTGNAPYWRLMDPYSNKVFESYFNQAQGGVTLPAAGTYTLLIEGRMGQTSDQSYAFQTLFLGNFAPAPFTGAAINFGQTISGTITNVGDTNRYLITVPSAGFIVFDDLTNDSRFVFSIEGPAGVAVSGQTFAQYNPYFYRVPVSGNYQVRIQANGGFTGPYGFRVLDPAAAPTIAPNVVQSATNPPANSSLIYRFNTTPGTAVYLDQISTTGYSPDVYLISPFGDLLGRFSVTDHLLFTPSATNAYNLLVTGQPYETAPEGRTSFRVVTQVIQTTVGFFSTLLAGAITNLGHHVDYVFDLPSETRIAVTSLTNASALRWRLSGPVEVVADNMYPPDTVARHYTLPAGQYRFTVYGSSDLNTGNYAFELLSFQNATPLVPDAPVNQSRPIASSRSVYRFDAVAGQQFWFDHQGASGMPDSQGWWYLEDPSGAQLVSNPGQDSTVFTVRGPGTYYLVAGGDPYDTYAPGSFNFTLRSYTPSSASITLGQTVSGDISVPGDVKTYQFTLASRTRVAFDNLTNSFSSLRWTLTGPHGLVVNLASLGGNNASQNWLDLSAGGYTLKITGDSGQTGSFRFRILDHSIAVPLAVNSQAAVTNSPGNAMQLRRVARTAGQRLFFDSLSVTGFSSPGSVRLRIFDPMGGVLVDGAAVNNYGPWDIQVKGDCLVVLDGTEGDISAQGVSSFRLSDAPISNLVLTVGTVVSNTLALPGEQHRYSFQLPQAARLFFDTRTTDYNFNWKLEGPGGVVVPTRNLIYSDGPNLSSQLLLGAGDYTLTVTASGDVTGGYDFALLDATSATPLNTGTTVNGALSPGNASVIYQFNAPAGYGLRFQSISGPANLYWRLLDPVGNQVWARYFSGTVQSNLLNLGGTYYLAVEGEVSSGSPGPFSFSTTLTSVSPPTLPAGTPITLGQTVVGSLVSATQTNSFLLTLTNAAWLYVDALTNHNTTLLNWSLRSTNGLWAVRQPYYSDQFIADPFVEVPAGQYQVDVYGAATYYHFRLLDPVSQAQPFTPGSTFITNTLSPGSATVMRSFTGALGQSFNFDGLNVSGSVDDNAQVRLYDAEGRLLWQQYGTGDVGPFAVAHAGVHYLMLEGHPNLGSSSGDVVFRLVPSANSTNNLIIGAVQTGSLSNLGDRTTFNFTLAASNLLFLDILTNTPGWFWVLQSVDGSVVKAETYAGYTDGSYNVSLLDLPPGSYQLVLRPEYQQATPFAFRLLNVTAAMPLSLGATITNLFNSASEMQLYSFNASAGDRFYYDSISQSGLSSTPYVKLYAPDRNVEFSQGGNQDRDTFTVAVSGQYIFALDASYSGNNNGGQFVFRLVPVQHVTNLLAFDTTYTITNTTPGKRCFYNFSLSQATPLVFDQITGANGSTWSLSGDAGTLVTERDWRTSDSGYSVGLHLVPAGSHTMTIYSDPGGQPLSFRVHSPASKTATLKDTPLTNLLSPGSISRWFSLQGAAGEMLFLEGRGVVSGGGPAPILRLHAPDGSIPLEAYINQDVGPFSLPNDGEYSFVMEGTFTASTVTQQVAHVLYSNPPKTPVPLFPNTAAPDLIVSNVTVSPLVGIQSGQSITVNWTLWNTGGADAGAGFFDRVIVRSVPSALAVVNTTVPYDLQANGVITPGTTRARQTVVTLPDGPNGAGSFEVIVAADTLNTVIESSEANNGGTNSFSSTIAPYPDLLVQSVASQPPAGWHPASNVVFSFVLTNAGNRATIGSWVNRLQLRNLSANLTLFTTNLTYNSTNLGDLNAAARFTNQAALTLPNNANVYGLMEARVDADVNLQLFEYRPGLDAETNNSTILLIPNTPDLQVSALSVNASPSAQSGAQLTVNWTLTNAGLAEASLYFYDRISVLNTNTGQTLVSTDVYDDASGANTIVPRQTRARQTQLNLPDGLAAVGTLEISVTTDFYNYRVEHKPDTTTGESNNVATIQLATVLAPYPDLVVSNLTVVPMPLKSGAEVVIRWDDINVGTAPATDAWHDRVQVVNTNTGSVLLDATVAHPTGSLGALTNGTSRLRQLTWTIPNGSAGAGGLRFNITSDYYNAVFEYRAALDAETNNGSSLVLTSSVSPYPDLQVATLTVLPASLESGAAVTVQWLLTNSGTATVTGDFYDRLQVLNLTAATTLFDQSYYLNPGADTNGSILPGQTRLRSASLSLPNGPAGVGNIGFYLTTDSGNRIFEFRDNLDAETNNQASLNRNSTLAVYPDVRVTSVLAPSNALPAQPLPVQWTLQNTGSVATASSWSDQIFLVNATNPASSQLLGTYLQTNALASGASRTITSSVALPFFAVGDYLIAVRANASQSFFELNFTNNYATATNVTALPGTVTLTFSPASISENAGSNSVTGTLVRNGSTAAQMVIALSASVGAPLFLPAQATIPAGQSQVTVSLSVVDDTMVNGTRTSQITATPAGLLPVSQNLDILDNDTPKLGLLISPTTVMEDSGSNALTAVVTRNGNTNTPLLVTLVSDTDYRIHPPTNVIIVAGATSVGFSIAAPSNSFLEGNHEVKIQAGADGYPPVTTPIQVLDNDAPSLALVFEATSLVEGAPSPATTATLSRSGANDQPVNITILQSFPGLLVIPSEIVLKAGVSSTNFPVNVRNDNDLNGTRSNLVTALAASVLGAPFTNGQAMATVLVFDDEGPSLTLTLGQQAISEAGSVGGTVRRNTGTNGTLVVQITSSDSSEAVPASASVIIPAGQQQAAVTINGVADGINDGRQAVSLTASATGFNSGTAQLYVNDTDLPDLQVASIIVPSSGQVEAFANMTYSVSNASPIAVSGIWYDEVLISTDEHVGGDIVAYDAIISGPLAPGAAYSRTASIKLPSEPGHYHVIVLCDALGNIVEGSEQNNVVSLATIDVQPNYHATVATDITSAPTGTPIPIHGHAYNPEDNSPAVQKPVLVRILNSSLRRTLTAYTDANGDYNTSFTPVNAEVGNYELAADHPAVKEDVVQDSFRITGFIASQSSVSVTMIPQVTVTNEFKLINNSDVPVTGLTMITSNAPAALGLMCELPDTIPPYSEVTLRCTMTTTIQENYQARFGVGVRSADGCLQPMVFNVQVIPLTARLAANPAFLQRGVLRGEQAVISFRVGNLGGADSGDLDVILPDLPWLSLASSNRIASLAPGKGATVTLVLSPPSDLPLNAYSGSITFVSSRAELSLPFQFTGISSAVGDLTVTVEDDFTYYAAGAPKVTNAVVQVFDGLSGNLVTNMNTDASGVAHFVGLPESAYIVDVSATRHTSSHQSIVLVPGVDNAMTAFLVRQTVTYQWSVLPIEIEDRYRIVLEPVFETEVPIPNVVVEEPRIVPLVVEGEATQIEISLRNEGLIAAEGVTLDVPDDPNLAIEPLITEIGTLPAKSTLVIPAIVYLKSAPPPLKAAATKMAAMRRKAAKEGGGCTLNDINACLPSLKLNVRYYYVCGANGIWQMRSINLQHLCVAKNVFDCIKDALGARGEGLKVLEEFKGNLLSSAALKGGGAGVICEIIGTLLSCADAADVAPEWLKNKCVKAAIVGVCKTAAGAIQGGGLPGAVVGAASGIFSMDTLECICSSIPAGGFSLPPPNGSNDSILGRAIGGVLDFFEGIPCVLCAGPGQGRVIITEPRQTETETGDCRGTPPPGLVAKSDPSGAGGGMRPKTAGGVCARVRLRIEQEAVLTRTAFRGTLEIQNNVDTPINGLRVEMDIRDDAGNPAGDKFAFVAPVLSGIAAVDGTGNIPPNGEISALYTFVPTRDAAPTAPEIYHIGGTLRYLDNGVEVVMPLLSTPITVYPEARLELDYFLSRNVYSDDPFTDEVEPSEPFYLGLRALNVGAGPARNFHITSAQPKIIENEKGLLIDFKIIGSVVGSNAAGSSLTVNLGNLDPGQSQVAAWFMTSTLQGKFIEYKAYFEHTDNLGNTNLSLIDKVTLHELIHPVLVDRPGDDGLMDFLVNDLPDVDSLPDFIFMSDGSKAFATAITTGTTGPAINPASLQSSLTFTPQAGFVYVKLADPGPGFKLRRVIRSDNKEIKVGTNVWTTDRTFPSALTGAVREHRIHLFDYDSTGSYTLYYVPDDSVPPQVVEVLPVTPALQTVAVDTVDVVFSEPVDTNTFTWQDVTLTLNGGPNLITSALTISQVATNQYRIGNLAPVTALDGNYELSVAGSGVADYAGNAGSGGASSTWAKGADSLVILSVGPVTPNPRNLPVDSVEVKFSRAVNPLTFDNLDVALKRDGSSNLLTASVLITALDTDRYLISGLSELTALQGSYNLVVNGAGVSDTNGVAGTGQLAVAWSTLVSGPQITSLEHLATNPRNIVVPGLDVDFNRAVVPASFTWQDLTLTRNGGPNLITSAVNVQSTSSNRFRISNFNWVVGQEGDYTLTVNAAGVTDLAGNPGEGSASESWKMDITRPAQPVNVRLVPDLGISTNDALINTLTPVLTGLLAETNLSVRVKDNTSGDEVGLVQSPTMQFAVPLSFAAPGARSIRIRVTDDAGNTTQPDLNFSLVMDTTSPSGTWTPVIPDVRVSPVTNATIEFTEPINPATFTPADLTLTAQGGANLINGSVSVVAMTSNIFQVNGLSALTAAPGNYSLSANLAGIEDLAGNAGSGMAVVTWARTGTNHAPVLSPIASRPGYVGVNIEFTNSATDPDGDLVLTFSLGSNAPANATVDAVTGVFGWQPTRSQSPGVYPISVIVQDSGVPSLMATQTFAVTVQDFFEAGLGEAIVLAGEQGDLNVRLISSSGLTNLTTQVFLPTNVLGQPMLINVNQLVSTANFALVGQDKYALSFVSQPGQSIRGSNNLAAIRFSTSSNQPSAFVRLPLTNAVALLPDGLPVASAFLSPGRAIVIGEQPLLEIHRGSNGLNLRVLAQPGSALDLLTAPSVNGPWTFLSRLHQPDRDEEWSLSPNRVPLTLFRLEVTDVDPPFFDIAGHQSNRLQAAFYGPKGSMHDLLVATNLTGPWATNRLFDMTNEFQEFEIPTDQRYLFLRSRQR